MSDPISKCAKEEEVERQRIAERLGYITEGQLCTLAGVKQSTLDSWRRRSKGPDYVFFGNVPLYSLHAVKKHLESSAREMIQEPWAHRAL